MDFSPCFKVHNFISVHPKTKKIVQITNVIVVFYVVVSDYRLLKIQNSPSSMGNLGMANSFIIHMECYSWNPMWEINKCVIRDIYVF